MQVNKIMIVEIILVVGDENRAVRGCILSDEYGKAIMTRFILTEACVAALSADQHYHQQLFQMTPPYCGLRLRSRYLLRLWSTSLSKYNIVRRN